MSNSEMVEMVEHQHTIAAGDTLSAIAKHYYGDASRWPELRDANPATVHQDGELIYAGERLTIPCPQPGDLEATEEHDGTGEPIDYSTMDWSELAQAMIDIATGAHELDTVNAALLSERIAALSLDDFSALVEALELCGQLFPFLRSTLGTDPVSGDIDFQVPLFCYRFWNAHDVVGADVETANTIYNHEGIEILSASERVISKAETESTVGHEVDDDWGLNRAYDTGDDGHIRYTDDEMVAIVNKYVTNSVICGLWAMRVYRPGGELAGTSSRESSFGPTHPRLAAVSTDFRGADTFAHELGHILIDTGHRSGDTNALMHSGGQRNKDHTGPGRLNEEELDAIRASSLGWAREKTCE